ncbi:hypothetical protein EV401DRAFT_1844360, partial [Pisolithus croceorrhizus]
FMDTCDEEEFYLACAPIKLWGVEALKPMHPSMGEMLVGHDIAICCIAPTPPNSAGWRTR